MEKIKTYLARNCFRIFCFAFLLFLIFEAVSKDFYNYQLFGKVNIADNIFWLLTGLVLGSFAAIESVKFLQRKK